MHFRAYFHLHDDLLRRGQDDFDAELLVDVRALVHSLQHVFVHFDSVEVG